MESTAAIARAMSDTNRLLALYALREGELCACQLSVLLDVAPSTVSNHMSILRHAGLVGSHKHGRWVRYAVCASTDAGKEALEWVFKHLDEDESVKELLKERLKAVDCDCADIPDQFSP